MRYTILPSPPRGRTIASFYFEYFCNTYRVFRNISSLDFVSFIHEIGLNLFRSKGLFYLMCVYYILCALFLRWTMMSERDSYEYFLRPNIACCEKTRIDATHFWIANRFWFLLKMVSILYMNWLNLAWLGTWRFS